MKIKYKFSVNWVEKNIDKWKDILIPYFQDIATNILEVGVFEGASTIWFINNLLTQGGTITCIDNFQGGIEHIGIKTFNTILSNLEERFLYNILKTKKLSHVTLIKDNSFNGLLMLNANKRTFNLIYIDGSHLASDVLSDAILAWNILNIGGILIFDDYKWEKYQEDYNNPRVAINSFLHCFLPEIDILHKSYQVIIKKKERDAKYTPNIGNIN